MHRNSLWSSRLCIPLAHETGFCPSAKRTASFFSQHLHCLQRGLHLEGCGEALKIIARRGRSFLKNPAYKLGTWEKITLDFEAKNRLFLKPCSAGWSKKCRSVIWRYVFSFSYKPNTQSSVKLASGELDWLNFMSLCRLCLVTTSLDSLVMARWVEHSCIFLSYSEFSAICCHAIMHITTAEGSQQNIHKKNFIICALTNS